MAIDFSPFTANDFKDFPGARSGSGGQRPILGFAGQHLVIADSKGIEVQLYDAGSYNVYRLENDNYETNLQAARLLNEGLLSPDYLAHLGFYFFQKEAA